MLIPKIIFILLHLIRISILQAQRDGEGDLTLPLGRVIKEGGKQNLFPSIKKNPDEMGQNEYDFRNQREKLPQKHVFIFQIHFDP